MDLGINLWGSDWFEGGQYLFPTEAEIDYFAAKGFTNIRLSFAWETIQPQLNGKLDADYVASIQKTVDYARSQGIDVILDVHNYGAYNGDMIGSQAVPVSAFADLWGRIAAAFADDANVRFGLMNEPQLPTASDWLKAANAAIAEIRKAGADQEILVPGAYWTGGQSWTTTDNAEVLGAPGAIVDPADNFAFEVHQYLDDTSGQNAWVVSETIGVERLTAITEWARAAGARLYLGEFGVADNAKALAALDNMLKYITDNDDVWQSASYWVAGRANPTYMFTVEPDFGLFDAPQMDVLENYTGAQTAETHLGDGTIRRDYYVDGRGMPSMSDVVSAAGVLISRTLFDADGDMRSQASVAADGVVTVTSYSDPGAAYPFERDVYDADHNLLTRTVADDTGASTVTHYHAGESESYRTEFYGSDGSIDRVVGSTGKGPTVTNYVDGLVSTVEHYNSSWTMLDRETYDDAGRLTQIQTDNADGTHTIALYDLETGKLYTATDYSASWHAFAITSYDGNENPVTRTTTLPNGYREVEHFSPGTDIVVYSDTLTADDKLVSRSYFNDDTLTAQIGAGEDVSAGVDIAGTGETVLTNNGTVAGDDLAIEDKGGTLTLINRGTIAGNVDLGSGDDVFDIRSGRFHGTVSGGAGDDTFKVSANGIRIDERAREGRDMVQSSVSFTLGKAIEDLDLVGKAAITGEGNALSNHLTGNSHNNKLFGLGGRDTMWGGAGRDILFGGKGSDTFELRANSGLEIVRDFEDGVDRLSVRFGDRPDIGDLLEHHLRQRGDDVVIQYGADRMIIEHMQVSEITAADFILT